MRKIKRRGLYCMKHKMPCEDAHVFIETYKHCEQGVRCNCPKCQYSAKITEDGERAIKKTPDGFEVAHEENDILTPNRCDSCARQGDPVCTSCIMSGHGNDVDFYVKK